jgi:4-hydroxybenzoate polyprenyltransferase
VLLVLAAALIIYSADSYFDGLRSRPAMAAGAGASGRGVIVVAALVAIGWTLWGAPPAAVVSVAIGGVLCLAYGAPLLPAGSPAAQRRRLRDIPGFKAPFVSAAITGAAIAVPLLYSGQNANANLEVPAPGSIAILASAMFGVILCNVYFFDIRDRHADAHSGVRTLPLLIGVRRTRQFCVGISSLLLAVWLVAPNATAAGPLMALLLAIVATLVYAMRLSADASRLRFAFIVDGVPYFLLAASLVLDGHRLT